MRIAVITTGGTIAKTYDEFDGSLRNQRPVVESLIGTLRLCDTAVQYRHVLNKDSLELDDADRALIVAQVRDAAAQADAVVVVHGTDTLAATGARLHAELQPPPVPVVLTGAMRPYEVSDSDAAQNVTEALLACRLVGPGVYVAMHSCLLAFPGVYKDRAALTFRRRADE